ncbi:hypothetical protein H072_6851 [Dactylellina haptotyla CBS 200.50]|uniref:Clr5 domain-containing protein n=1 Tax=Dactylellina haptotyla (strain CBS 200.50) TaxID=1284197 RepID=S8A937_DACHA|nr:hypothetical protein H072_6851 [Dactylellina haptotyla CBS 200.50]
MPRRKTFQPVEYDGGHREARPYIKKESWEPYKDYIIAERANGRKLEELVQDLQSFGVPMKLGKLKRLLRLWNVSKKNTTQEQRLHIVSVCKAHNERGLPHPRMFFGDGEPIRRTQIEWSLKHENLEGRIEPAESVGIIFQEEDDSDSSIGSLDAPGEYTIYNSSEPFQPRTFISLADYGLSPNIEGGEGVQIYSCLDLPDKIDMEAIDPFLLHCEEPPQPTNYLEDLEDTLHKFDSLHAKSLRSQTDDAPKLTDSHEVWSGYSKHKQCLDGWTGLGEKIARSMLKMTPEEIENLNKRMETLAKKSRATTFQDSWFKFMHWQTGFVPQYILRTFLPESIPRTHFLSPDEARDSHLLRTVFERNFPSMVEIAIASRGDPFWDYDFYSQAVHLIAIEKRFGPSHYYLVQAVFKVATILERHPVAPNYEDIITLMHIVLKKLDMLGLRDSPSRDYPHALAHLRRAVDMVGTDEAAIITTETRFYDSASTFHKNHEAFREARQNMHDGMFLVRRGKHDECVKHFTKAHAILERQSSEVGTFISTHGHQNTASDFLIIGKNLKRAGHPELAVASFQKAIFHYSAANWETSARLFEAVKELGVTFAYLGRYQQASVLLKSNVSYLVERHGLNNARMSIKIFVDVMQARGPVFYMQPDKQGYLGLCESEVQSYEDEQQALVNASECNFMDLVVFED